MKIFFSLIFYLLGVGSILIIDFMYANSGNIDAISKWALLKSVAFLSVFVVLLGSDQALVRMKKELPDILIFVLFQFIVLSALICVFVYLLDINLEVIYLFPILVLMALLYLFYADNRLKMKFSWAQIVLHGWKFILLLILLYYGLSDIDYKVYSRNQKTLEVR